MNEERPDGFDRLVTRLRHIDARRDTNEGWLAGICAGAANRLGVSPLLIRAVAILLVLSGIGLVLYLAAWCLLPDEGDRVVLDEARTGERQGPMVLLVVTALAIIVSSPWGFGLAFMGHPGPIVSLVAIAALAFHVVRSAERHAISDEYVPHPPTAVPGQAGEPSVTPVGYGYGDAAAATGVQSTASVRDHYRSARAAQGLGGSQVSTPRARRRARRRRTRMPFPAFLLLLGVGLLVPAVVATGWHGDDAAAVLPWMVFASLAAISLGAIALALRGFRIGVLSILVLPLMLLSATFTTLHEEGYSSRTSSVHEQPATLARSQLYDAGFGDSTVDLTRVNLTTMPTTADVRARLTAGRLEVRVPPGVKVELTSRTRVGSLTVESGTQSWYGEGGAHLRPPPTHQTFGSGDKTIRLTTDVGLGDTQVRVTSTQAN